MENFKCQRVVIVFWAFFWVCFLDTIISHSRVEGKQIIPEKYRSLKHKGTIKTIVCPEDDDVIDCVDFYQQPAFYDPIIKSLKVESDLFSDETEMTDGESYLYQTWRKYGECPSGTIPIRRSLDHSNYQKKSYNDNRQYAVVTLDHGNYFGARANLSIWNPKVANIMESSSSQILLASNVDDKESIQAGWIVAPDLYALSNTTRFFIHWTRDNWGTTGCYDHNCAGFVQTNKQFVLGGTLSPLSTYEGKSYHIHVEISRDGKDYGDWWLTFNGRKIGYWPRALFKNLSGNAMMIRMGGEVMSQHTFPEMGSGHFANEGFGRASYISNIAVQDFDLNWDVPTTNLQRKESSPTCYSVKRMPRDKQFGTHFYFGGPGRLARDCI